MPSVDDELFALGFELRALAHSYATQGKSERWVDLFVPERTSAAHRARYSLASGFVANRRVLDIACGTGSGSRALADRGNANEVIGVDIDAEAIRYARIRNRHERCSFHAASVDDWTDAKKYDVVISFETIEHLTDPDGLLRLAHQVLDPGGACLISTPIAVHAGAVPKNPFHVREWTVQGFRDLLQKHGFAIDRTWYQGVRGVAPDLMSRLRRKLNARSLRARAEPFHQGEIFDSVTPYEEAGLLPKFQIHCLAQRSTP